MNLHPDSPFEGPAPTEVGPGLVFVIAATCVFAIAVSWFLARRDAVRPAPTSTELDDRSRPAPDGAAKLLRRP